VFTFSVRNRLLVLTLPGKRSAEDWTIRLLPLESVTTLVVREPRPATPAADPIFEVDVARRRQRERERLERSQAEAEAANPAASREGRAVYLALRRTMECKWDGVDIVVLGEVRVAPPYSPGDCVPLPAGSAGSLERVRRVLAAARAKVPPG